MNEASPIAIARHAAAFFTLLLCFAGAGPAEAQQTLACPETSISNTVVDAALRGDIRLLERVDATTNQRNFANCPNFAGHLPINEAIIRRRRAAVQWLLDHGANPDYMGPKRRLPLITATAFKQYYSTRAILLAGADPDGRDPNGKTALHIAAASGSTRIVRLLLEFDADPDLIDKSMHTPLIVATLFGHVDAVGVLLDGNAGLERRDLYGKRALDIARELKFAEIEKLITNRQSRL